MSATATAALSVRLETATGEVLHTDTIWVHPERAVPTVIIWRGQHYVCRGQDGGALCFAYAPAYHLVDPTAGSHVRSPARAREEQPWPLPRT